MDANLYACNFFNIAWLMGHASFWLIAFQHLSQTKIFHYFQMFGAWNLASGILEPTSN